MPKRKATKPYTVDADFDQLIMRRALRLARRGEGRVESNPMVGCVITKGRKILSEGYHRRFGGPHAEIVALEKCTERTRGSTVYVTLEPCGHFGKTPPCVAALLAAKVGRVVIGVRDPNPAVDGKSVRALRRAGVRVDLGTCAQESADVLAPFFTRFLLKRPYVIAKWAQTLDGKLATYTGDSQWISNEASRRLVHRLRGRVDAIVVGVNTVLTDDPQLTARDVRIRRVACRVVLDGRLRIPNVSNLVTSAGKTPTIVMTSRESAVSDKAQKLERRGVSIVPVTTREGQLAPKACLKALAKLDMTNVLLEGGATAISSFYRAGLIDEAWIFSSATLLGDERVPQAITGLRTKRMRDVARPRVLSVKTIGNDVLHRLRFNEPPT